MTGQTRKKDTGEIGNGGHFGSKTQSEADPDTIAKPRFRYAEASILDRHGLDHDLVKSIERVPYYTHITLNRPHPTGGYTKVNIVYNGTVNATSYEGDAITPEGNRYRGTHRLDGPAWINHETGEDKYIVAGRELADEAELAAAAIPTKAQIQTACILNFGLEPDMVATASIEPDQTWILLKEPHPTGGWSRLVDLHGINGQVTTYDVDASTDDGFTTRALHRLDGPAVIDSSGERWFHWGQQVPAGTLVTIAASDRA